MLKQDNSMILVTGGAGYIGSQVVRQLQAIGEDVMVLDDLSTGNKKSLSGCHLEVGGAGDRKLLDRIFNENPITAVMHFAANTLVHESVSNPIKYYNNNTANTVRLIEACVRNKIKHFVFSSSASVYGLPDEQPVSEEAPLKPINPYGKSKMLSEIILDDAVATTDMTSVTLRYFNVAGADPHNGFGPFTKESTLLMRVAAQVAIGARSELLIYGDNYNTPDGTGIRDFIHVVDIANAHIAALQYLREGGESVTLNCGYGRGFSVKQVVDVLEKITGKPIKKRIVERRPGDPGEVVANNAKLCEVLDWQPQHADLEKMMRDTLQWEERLFARD